MGSIADAPNPDVAAHVLDPLAATLELRTQYAAYRRRQARKLVGMLPKEAIRPLYRRALAGVADPASDGEVDPLGLLVAACEAILPLPPFQVWVEDMTLHPVPHLHDVDESAEAPSAEAPATMDARLFDYRDQAWVAHLRGFRDGIAWKGYIAFEHRASQRVHHTAVIFREADPAELCERFASFETGALEAFLRSALP